ncbi:hypothetical protein YC2023_096178 [Brassica napus]
MQIGKAFSPPPVKFQAEKRRPSRQYSCNTSIFFNLHSLLISLTLSADVDALNQTPTVGILYELAKREQSVNPIYELYSNSILIGEQKKRRDSPSEEKDRSSRSKYLHKKKVVTGGGSLRPPNSYCFLEVLSSEKKEVDYHFKLTQKSLALNDIGVLITILGRTSLVGNRWSVHQQNAFRR